MDKRDQFISDLRKEAKQRGLDFATNRKRGKGGHVTVVCGERLATPPVRVIDAATGAKIRTQLGLA